MDSVQEQIVKKAVQVFAGIRTADGYANTVQSVQRFSLRGVNLSALPVVLVMEGEAEPELDKSPAPWTQRRFELYAVVLAIEVEGDSRSGGEILNSLVADVEQAAMRNPTWGGLAQRTDPPAYLEATVEASQPVLSKALRFDVVYRHLRDNPASQG
ncbi:hypothetical protein [Candidatus Nitrospira bockiana]